MADVFTKSKRSQVMAAIRGKGNLTTEWRFRSRLIQAGISGWRVGSTDIPGKPDFSFHNKKLAVFIDGCFWHGCRRCRNIPDNNRSFWLKKIRSNKKRDGTVNRSLRSKGWKVIRLWEHQLRDNPDESIAHIYDLLNKKR